MELTFDMLRHTFLDRVQVCREDGSAAYTLKSLPIGTVYVYNEDGELLGSVDNYYNVYMGPDIFIGRADFNKNWQQEWFQIHYFCFWTAEKARGEDCYQVSLGQGQPIGTIRREELSIREYRYTLSTQDPKNFLMMLMLSLIISVRYRRKKFE